MVKLQRPQAHRLPLRSHHRNGREGEKPFQKSHCGTHVVGRSTSRVSHHNQTARYSLFTVSRFVPGRTQQMGRLPSQKKIYLKTGGNR